MKEECRGCHLMRIFLEDNIITYTSKQITCEHEDLVCPCKTCLVKTMCDIIENGMKCKPWVDFNMKYSTNEFWKERNRNANKV